jgi:hypothetical protein
MKIENIAELSEQVFFEVLKELSLDDFKSGFIKLDDDGLGFTENTEKGQELYFSIEGVIENFLKGV